MAKTYRWMTLFLAALVSGGLLGAIFFSDESNFARFFTPFFSSNQTVSAALRSATSESDKRLLVLTGGSSMRELLLSEATLDAHLTSKMETLDLSSTSQPIWYGLENAHRAVCNRGGIVVIPVNVGRFRFDPYTYRQGDTHSWWSEQTPWSLKHRSQNIVSLINVTALSAAKRAEAAGRAIMDGPGGRKIFTKSKGRHRYGVLEERDLGAIKPIDDQFLKEMTSKIDWQTDEVLTAIELFQISLEKCKQTEVVFVVPPMNPLYLEGEFLALRQSHLDYVDKWASAKNIRMIDLNLPKAVPPVHFIDAVHLRSATAMAEATLRLANGLFPNPSHKD